MSLIISTVIVVGFVGWGVWREARAYLKFRGQRIVTCPQTQQPAGVELAIWHIAMASTLSEPRLRLRNCSRWREVAACNAACLPQIVEAPEKCLVSTILSRWYAGKICTCCGRPVGRISRWQHKPCLLSPELRIFEWKDIPAENIPRALGTHAPVCWKCLVAETHIN
jgi:hypothetical protein